MQEVKIFKNSEFSEVRTITIDSEFWFVGKDVARALGYSNTRKAILDHVYEDDKKDGVTIRDSIGREQMPLLVNESGVYSLIFGSKLESAKRFKHWVTHDVLPSLRKNGGYIMNQENLTPEQIVANALVVAQNIIANQKQEIETMKPKAEYFDDLVDRKLNITVRDTAKELGLKQKEFVAWLLDCSFVYRKLKADGKKGNLRPYSKFCEHEEGKGYFVLKETKSSLNGWAGTQMLITPRGREAFKLLLAKAGKIKR